MINKLKIVFAILILSTATLYAEVHTMNVVGNTPDEKWELFFNDKTEGCYTPFENIVLFSDENVKILSNQMSTIGYLKYESEDVIDHVVSRLLDKYAVVIAHRIGEDFNVSVYRLERSDFSPDDDEVCIIANTAK